MESTQKHPYRRNQRKYGAIISAKAAVIAVLALFLGGTAVAGEAGRPAAAAADTGAVSTVNTEKNDANRVYDLYIMSKCPYGIKALADLAELIRAFPHREWNVWFVGTADGERLASLRGEAEMFDEMLWLGVKALFPFRYHEFLFLRSGSAATTEELLDEMGLDVRKIRYWVDDAGPSELRRHYVRSMSLNVNASPTLFVNNRLFDKPMGGGRLMWEECRAAAVKPAFCGKLPECFEDDDCVARGKIGGCLKSEDGISSVCEFRDDAVFVLTVLVADSAADSPERQPIEAVAELLPGVRVNIVKFSSDAGKKIMARHAPPALPFFHFEKQAEGAYRFSSIREMLVKVSDSEGGFTFRKGAVGENYFPMREEKRGLVELYADPLMPGIDKVINTLLSSPDLAARVVLRPAVFKDPAEGNLTAQERLRAEEALRWLVLAGEFPKKYHAYLKLYAESPASSYWFNWLKKIGVNKKKFIRRLEANQPKLTPHVGNFAAVSSGEPVVILVNNRMKVAVGNESELVRILGSVLH